MNTKLVNTEIVESETESFNENFPNLYYIDGICGSGKTSGLIKYTQSATSIRQNIIISSPSRRLKDQTKTNLKLSTAANVFDLTSDKNKNVRRSLLNHFSHENTEIKKNNAERYKQNGEIVLSTHAALIYDPPDYEQMNLQDSHVFVDEIPTVLSSTSLNISEHFDVIGFTFKKSSYSSEYYVIDGFTDMEIANKILQNKKKDVLYNILYELYSKISNPHYDVVVTEKTKLLIEQGMKDKKIPGTNMDFIFVLKPSILTSNGAKSSTVMGAFIKKSLMYLLWKKNVNFVEHNKIKPSYTEYPEHINERIEIYYMSEYENSRRYQMNLDEDFLKMMNTNMNLVFGDEPALYCVNDATLHDKKYIDYFNEINKKYTYMASKSQGDNSKTSFRNICYCTSLRYPPQLSQFIEACGISSDIIAFIEAETIHQAIFRTAIRLYDENDKSKIKVIVPAKSQALILASYFFNGAQVFSLATEQTKLTVDPSDHDNKKQYIENCIKLSDSVPNFEKHIENYNIQLKIKEMFKEIIPPQNNDISLCSLHRTYSSTISHKQMNHEGVISMLEKCCSRNIKSKSENELFSLTKYCSDDSRKKDNIEHIQGIILDIDDGEINPKKLQNYFQRRGITVVIVNTHSNGVAEEKRKQKMRDDKIQRDKENAERVAKGLGKIKKKLKSPKKTYSYRVIILFSQPVQDMNLYEAIYNTFVKNITKFFKGFKHGIDPSKKVASSFFYLPCKSVLHSKNRRYTFFLTTTGSFYNPYENIDSLYIKQKKAKNKYVEYGSAGVKLKVRQSDTSPYECDIDYIADALETLHNAPPGTGHNSFFKFALKLAKTKLSAYEIEDVLNKSLSLVKSPDKRRKEIDNIMSRFRHRH